MRAAKKTAHGAAKSLQKKCGQSRLGKPENATRGVVQTPVWLIFPGVILFAAYVPGVPLLPGSWWGPLPVPFFMAGPDARAVGEKRIPRQALPGYDDNIRRVRVRLIPGVC